MASLIRTIQTRLSVSLLQAQLNFFHLENNAEDDMSAIAFHSHQDTLHLSSTLFDGCVGILTLMSNS